jgi:hypothetical protein
MSKGKVVSVLDKKISSVDNESRALEKNLAKGGIDLKSFLDEYIDKRKNFHKYQILKVKVNQS